MSTAVPHWELHHRLARALEWAGITADEMAVELGVHVNSIHNYASGRGVPKRGFILQWAFRCQVPRDWLEYGEDDHDDGGGSAATAANNGWYRPLVAA